MKRSPSSTPSPSSSATEPVDVKQHIPPSPAKAPKNTKSSAKRAPDSGDSGTPKKKVKASAAHNAGMWTPEKKAVLLDEVFGLAYKLGDLEALATKLGVSKRQVIDQLVPNRVNLRAKVCKTVSGGCNA